MLVWEHACSFRNDLQDNSTDSFVQILNASVEQQHERQQTTRHKLRIERCGWRRAARMLVSALFSHIEQLAAGRAKEQAVGLTPLRELA